MTTQQVGLTDIVCSRLAYGCMRYLHTWNPADVTPAKEAEAERAILTAYESGYTLFDHADIYCDGACETAFGKVLKKNPGLREKIFIATKCGIVFPGRPHKDSPHRYDFSKEHILKSCDESLRRLQIDSIDIYQLHRPDILMDPNEVGEAFERLRAAGKVRFFGVSNFMPSFVNALQTGLKLPICVNQVEIHLGRLAPFYDGTLDQCLELSMTPLSWSPLGGGFLGEGGTVGKDNPRKLVLEGLVAKIDEIAKKYEVSRTVMSLAWLMKHPSKIIPIVGSTNPENIQDAAKADDIDLDREDWYRILVAARGEPLP